MDLKDLTHEQQLALVALTEALTIADGQVSQAEGTYIDLLATALGDEAYRALLDEAEQRFSETDDLKTFLRGITGREARETIYGTVLNEFISDPSIATAPSDLVHWLSDTWDIDAKQADEADDRQS